MHYYATSRPDFWNGDARIKSAVGRLVCPAVATLSILAIESIVTGNPAVAEPLSRASRTALSILCLDDTITKSPPLQAACNNQPTGLFSATPGGGPGSSAAGSVEERLQSVREAEEEKREGRRRTGLYALNSPYGGTADVAQLAVPPAAAKPPSDVFIDLGRRLGVFASAGAFQISHRNNRFEDGYSAKLPTVTLGADYRIADWLLVGLAFNYANFDATYDDGGNSDRNSYSPLVYATVLPLPDTFVDVVLGYARQDNFMRRHIVGPLEGGIPPLTGNARADYDTDQYSAAILAGYDLRIADAAIGPRVGLNVVHWQTDGFEERGDTGLELKYGSLDRTSVQSSLGARAAALFETGGTILQPWVGAAWVHEFADDARNIRAEFTDASPSPSFTFQREAPDRNWAEIGVGLTALLPNGLQPFVTASTVQGNSNFVTYGGIAGVRMNF
jgi:outer membrane autotransporter protein